jgi:hypothetical protein
MQIRWLGLKRNSGGAHRRDKSGEVVLELVVGEVPASGDGDEVADGDQQTTGISKTWSSRTCASRGDGDVRLESAAASAIVGELGKLQQKGEVKGHSMRQREGSRLGGSGSEGMLHRADAVENRRRVCTVSGERFGQPGGFVCGERGEGRERGVGAL